MAERTDVLVVGGGPVGVFLGALLAHAGVDVQVWERRTAEPTGSRAIGIHPPSLDAFAAIGVDHQVIAEATLVRRGSARSRGRTLGTLSFAGASQTHPYVATLDQHRTEAILRGSLERAAPGALRVGATLTGLVQEPGQVLATGVDQDGGPLDLRAAFVVGADGARSVVRDLLGIETDVHEYPHRYVMGDFADVEPPTAKETALVDVGPDGVVESFPLPGGRRRYVALVNAEQTATPEALATLITARTGAAPDPMTCTRTNEFRVRRRIAPRVGVGRVVLIGDAAHEISPIGGQGMNLGWLDAAALAPLLASAVRSGESPPGSAWAEYARRRQSVARRAARQAEANMSLGRPLGPAGLMGRELLLRAALRTPVAGLLAGVYAMRRA